MYLRGNTFSRIEWTYTHTQMTGRERDVYVGVYKYMYV